MGYRTIYEKGQKNLAAKIIELNRVAHGAPGGLTIRVEASDKQPGGVFIRMPKSGFAILDHRQALELVEAVRDRAVL